MTADDAIRWLADQRTTAPNGRITLERSEAVAVIWLDHDEARNALTVSMMNDLALIVEDLHVAPPALWMVRGRGRAFCAGGHLGDVRASLATPEAGRAMATAMAHLLGRLEALPSLGVTVVHGAAVGGGAELAVLGDLCLMQRDAVLVFAQAERGVACGWGGAERLVARVGPRRALSTLIALPRMTATEAESAGLARCVPSASDAADSLAERVRALPIPVVRAAIDAVRGRRTEVDAFASVWGQDAHLALLEDLPWGRR